MVPFALACLALLTLDVAPAVAHGVSAADRAFMEQGGLMAFLYLGAKHMVTGYDHLLFLVGVIFFLYRMKDVALYVTLFAVGHSVTLLYGVLSGTHVDAYLVDAIIGFSVVYKALDNLGAFRAWFGVQPDTKAAVLLFGSFTASASPPSCRTSRCRAPDSPRRSWRSTPASRSGSCWRSVSSCWPWPTGAARRPSPIRRSPPTSS